MAAQLEEAVVATDLLNLQYALPDLRQLRFQSFSRGNKGTLCRTAFSPWQGLTVEFAVVVERQLRQQDQMARHHVFRQRFAHNGLEPFQIVSLGIHHAAGDDVRHQLRAVLGDDRRFAHLFPGLQAGFDLAHFDAEAANFHLMIDAPDVFQIAVGVVARQVTAAVQTCARFAGKRVRQETFGGQRRTVEIALRQAGRGTDAQLADAISRQQLTGRIQHIQRSAGNGATDRDAKRVAGIVQTAFMHARHHGRFGRPVGVEQTHMTQTGLMPQAQTFHRHGFAANVHLTQIAKVAHHTAGAFAGQQEPVGGGQVGHGHALLNDFRRQSTGVPQVIATHDQRRANAQRRVALLDEAVEAEGRELQHTVSTRQH
ncbi:hypothetical protein D3C86_975500 [compost metagenome]